MAAFVLTVFFNGSHARAEKIGGVEVNVLPTASKETVAGTICGTHHGYVEHRIQLRNTSTEDRLVHLAFPNLGNGWNMPSIYATRTVAIAGKQVGAVSMFEPYSGESRNYLQVTVDGVKDPVLIQAESLHTSWYSSYGGSGPIGEVAVLLSRAVPQEFRDRTYALPETPAAPTTPPPSPMMPHSYYAPMATPPTPADRLGFMRSELPVHQWSANWLGYSCFDVIVMTEQEAREMPSQVQLALRRYLECGGTLLIHGVNVPDVFSHGGVPDGDRGYWVGLGRVVASLDEEISEENASKSAVMSLAKRITGVKNGWEATYKTLFSIPIHVYNPTEKPSRIDEWLVAEATVPVRGLFVLVLLFGIGIGPANLWLLSRYQRRIWLWWNVPAISLLTCFIVFAYALASEGIAGRGKTASITLLDERCHRAATMGYLSYYCPLTPTGPHFSVDTEVTFLDTQLQPWQRYSPRGSGNSRRVDWTQDQYLASGWISARVPAYFQIRKNEDRRERLTVEKKSDGSIKIVNALGANIRRLNLADAEGRVFEGRDIPAGAERTLSPIDIIPAPEGGQQLLRNIYHTTDWLSGFSSWQNSLTPGAMLSPGCYIAHLDKSPFVESPVEDVNPEHTVAIVYGISKEQPDGR